MKTSNVVRVLGFILCTQPTSWGASRPDWINETKREEGEYLQYVGRADNQSSEAAAIRTAWGDCRYQAVVENFSSVVQGGVYYSNNPNGNDHARQLSEVLAKTVLTGFERAKEYTEKADPGFNAYVLCKYKKAQIKTDQEKSLELLKTQSPKQPTRFGNGQQSGYGSVEVISEPPGADIYIDDERWGKTPAVIEGQLIPGKHILKIDHPYFEIEMSEITVFEGTTFPIRKTLRPARGTLDVTSNLDNALIYINGRFVGKAPGRVTDIQAGKRYFLSVTHPDGYDFVTELFHKRGETIAVYALLPLNQSGKEKLAAKEKAEKEAEERRREPASYAPGNESGASYGGLSSDRQAQNMWILAPYYKSYPHIEDGSNEGGKAFGAALERKVSGVLGIRVQGGYLMSSYIKDGTTHSTKGSLWGLSLPVYIFQGRCWSLMLEPGFVNSSLNHVWQDKWVKLNPKDTNETLVPGGSKKIYNSSGYFGAGIQYLHPINHLGGALKYYGDSNFASGIGVEMLFGF